MAEQLPENPIVQVREDLGRRVGRGSISQGELAELAGISLNTIYNLEAGRVERINPKLLEALEELDFDRDRLVEDYRGWREENRRRKLEQFKKGKKGNG